MEEGPFLEQLRLTALSLANSVGGMKRRRAVGILLSALPKAPRIKLLRGFRGVGKTTVMLHAFSESDGRALYFSADAPAVKSFGLYNTGKLAVMNGYLTLFIDEIHTFLSWESELKALHDEFPSLRIVASGSAPLALTPGRREELMCLHEMTLSESISLRTGGSPESLEEWRSKEDAMRLLASNPGLEAESNAYFKTGGFPLSIGMDESKALDAIFHSIKKSVREDAVYFLKMSKEKVFAMENLLNLLSTSKPGELSVTSLSSSLHVSKTTVYEIIDALEGMEIVRVLRPDARGAALVRSEPKLLFFHPNLRHAVCKALGVQPDTGAIREESAVFGLSERGWKVSTIKGEKKSPDYAIEKGGERLVVEIGGHAKGRHQMKGFDNGVVIGPYQLISLILVGKSAKID